MKFNSLFSLIKESSEDDWRNYEDWEEYIDWEEEILASEVQEFSEKFNLSGNYYCNGKLLKIQKDNYSYWFELDEEVYSKIADSDEDMINHISNINDYTKLEYLNITEDDVYIGGWESSIGDTKEYPGIVYHYTNEDAWNDIQKSGKMNTSYGTGLTNRGARGIFTSVSPETNALGQYGDVLLEIDLSSFKQDYNIDKLDLSPEPEVFEEALNAALASVLDLQYDEYVSSDMSLDTIIVGHAIPLKYIKRID